MSGDQHPPDNEPKREAELDDPVVVGIAGGHGRAAPCGLADAAAPDELAVELLELLVIDDLALDPPGDAGKPDGLGRLAVGTLRGSQPNSIEQVGFAGLVKKLLAPGFGCVAWAVAAPVDGTAACAVGSIGLA